jgi:predicted TIM-barrel fold metal-dependent hydrolase
MELPMKKVLILAAALVFGVVAGGKQQAYAAASSTGADNAVSGLFTSQELQKFAALDPIDTHAHVYRNDAAFHALFKKLNLHILDIVLVDDQAPEPVHNNLVVESKAAWGFVRASHGRAAFCTSFDPYKVGEPGFAGNAIRELNREFSRGAIAVKLWKNVGMEIQDDHGNYILPDNPIFAPIYKDIAAHHKTLVAHIADPSSAWEPENPASPDYSYYKQHPVWYMYNKPHPDSKEQIIAARDHVLEQNPKLRLVGAHLGSMEADFNQIAQHLDRYPNFAVEVAARVPYMMLQPRDQIIAFIVKYQDRLIYATDNTFSPENKLDQKLDDWEKNYARDWRFFATNDTLDYKGHPVQGLALPDAVLRKLYHANAVRWFPGIVPGSH